ncbi:MAG: MICOS complex subunit MIC60 [Verrucomicrobiae bacterium]|nr:MICOS complex subunit MIC60 [Verrucomicrobiae bacterium]
MKSGSSMAVWVIAAIVLCQGRVPAAAPEVPPGQEKKLLQERPVVIPRNTPQNPAEKPERKGRPDKTQPADIKEMIAAFQAAREQFLREQEAVRRAYQTATPEQREQLREQLRESLERWREIQRELLKEQRDRAQDMKRELQADLGKIVDEAKGEGRGR